MIDQTEQNPADEAVRAEIAILRAQLGGAREVLETYGDEHRGASADFARAIAIQLDASGQFAASLIEKALDEGEESQS